MYAFLNKYLWALTTGAATAICTKRQATKINFNILNFERFTTFTHNFFSTNSLFYYFYY